MEDTCKDFKNREEEIFWTHFQSIHFSQFLHGDFLQRLEIPETFAKNIKKKLPAIAILKGPSCVIWDVGLTSDGDAVFFGGGWKTFAEDHSLVENDFLIFKYNGVSHYDVLMFDGRSLKCKLTEPDCGHQSKRKASEHPDEIVHNSSQCGLESSPEKSINNEICMRPSRKPINANVSVPITWVAKYLPKENANVILRINKRTRKIQFLYRKCDSRDRGGLSAGWRNFVCDNNLEEHDVCVFEPANIGEKPIIVDVKIFHILQPAVPPNPHPNFPSDIIELD